MFALKAMIKKWLRPEGHEDIGGTPKEKAVFGLYFRSLPIGILTFEDGGWRFEYTEEFKRQDRIKPLSDFPDVNKVYTFEHLPPFFLIRIPNPNQSDVQAIIREEKIDPTNEIQLLKRFGRRTAANPYSLRPM